MVPKYEVLIGDNRETLRTLHDESVQCVVTSPPYYGLRDYGNDAQIGLEQTPDEYVAALVDVFREVRRVLRDDGVLWLNLGDSYVSSNGYARAQKEFQREGRNDAPANDRDLRHLHAAGFKTKDLIGIPWRVAFALQADGWYLRQDIIWHKPNPMPESVTDRCTKAHEYLFLLSKSARYYYDAEAVKEAVTESSIARLSQNIEAQTGTTRANGGAKTNGNLKAVGDPSTGRNRRSVWTVATQPYSGAHFATFPPKLIEPCILAGTPEKGCCPHCGAPWERVVTRGESTGVDGKRDDSATTLRDDALRYSGRFGKTSFRTTGHRPTCNCPAHEPVPSTVLDPFGGSGTTAGVALEHGRNAILCELSPEYAELIPERIDSITDALRQRRLL